MAIKSLENPFADYGNIVSGNRFIGRGKELLKIKERVLGTVYGNLAIMGLPRVGKSSLAWHAIMDRQDELESQKTIPVFLGIGSCKDNKSFFKKMVFSMFEELELVCNNEKCINVLKEIYRSLRSEYDNNLVQKFFKIEKRFGYKSIFIFDEFDSVQAYFEKADFQFLRELSYSPDTHLCLVTTSRKTIEDIEVKDGAISNFAGTFSDLRLGMFSDEDVNEYWQHFEDKFSPTEEYKETVRFFVGNHPWLMDKVNCKMFGLDLTDSIIAKFDGVRLELMQALDDMVATLKKENLLNSAIQLIVGPFYSVNQKQIEKLLRYDFIKRIDIEYKNLLFSGMTVGPSWNTFAYICFSDFSTLDLYRRYYANVPYVSIWSETENLLRSAVKDFLKLNFSEDWENELTLKLTSHPPFRNFPIDRWKQNLQSLKDNSQRMIQTFPSMAGGDVVDFTLTSQIFDIFIKPNWEWFNTHIFKGGSRDFWYNKFDYLTKLRNPIAHNNKTVNMDKEMEIATGHCKDVSTAIREWQMSKNEQ